MDRPNHPKHHGFTLWAAKMLKDFGLKKDGKGKLCRIQVLSLSIGRFAYWESNGLEP